MLISVTPLLVCASARVRRPDQAGLRGGDDVDRNAGHVFSHCPLLTEPPVKVAAC